MLKPDSSASIGVFDSGLGGLTVVKEIIARLPDENILYLGDNARVPYGTRSAATVERYAWNCSRFLVDRGVKMLVIACNTASAVAVRSLSLRIDVPVLGVIRAGARAALAIDDVERIGVIGTAGTVGSGAYPEIIARMNPTVKVFQNPAPLLVPLVEEGWIEGDVPRLAVERYLSPLISRQIDVLLLGCTHYPVLGKVIEETLGNAGCRAKMVDSATAMTDEVETALNTLGLRRSRGGQGRLTCFVTDLPDSFGASAVRFLGQPVDDVEKVDIS